MTGIPIKSFVDSSGELKVTKVTGALIVDSFTDDVDLVQKALKGKIKKKLKSLMDYTIYDCVHPHDASCRLLTLYQESYLLAYVKYTLAANRVSDELAGQRKGAPRIIGESPITYLYRHLIDNYDLQSDTSMTLEGFRMWVKLVARMVRAKTRKVFVSSFKTKRWVAITSDNVTTPGKEHPWWIEQLVENQSNTIFISKTKPTKFF